MPPTLDNHHSGAKGEKASVLFVGNFLPPGVGSHCICNDFASRLTSSGRPILTTSAKVSRAGRLLDMLGTAWRHRREYEAAHVDVFSGPAFAWAEMSCWLLRRLGKPYALTLRGGNLPAFARRWPNRVGKLLRSAEAVTAPSRYLLEQMSPYAPGLHLYPNPVDLSACAFRLRADARPRLVWLRAFNAVYNPALAPQVLALLAADFPSAVLTMVGSDKGDGSLQAAQQKAAELGVAERTHFPGPVPKSRVPALLHEGDIFLNTTNVDNTPVSVLEAMACGLCVVSTNVGGIPYLLEHEGDALLVPPGDAAAMAAAVRRILTEPGLAERLSRNARRKAAQFDWAAILPRWETLMDSLTSIRSTGRARVSGGAAAHGGAETGPQHPCGASDTAQG